MKLFSETVKNFLCLFQIQACSVVKVYKYLHYMSRKYTSTFLCLDTIARATGFCKRQVQRAIDKLIKLGWLGKMQRKRQSSIFFIPEDIKKLDICDNRLFENKIEEKVDLHSECPLNVHPSIKSYLGNESLDMQGTRDFSDQNEKKECPKAEVYPRLKPLKSLNDDEKFRLTRDFSEYEIEEAFHRIARHAKAINDTRCKWIKGLCGYLYTACRTIRGEENTRKAYYQT